MLFANFHQRYLIPMYTQIFRHQTPWSCAFICMILAGNTFQKFIQYRDVPICTQPWFAVEVGISSCVFCSLRSLPRSENFLIIFIVFSLLPYSVFHIIIIIGKSTITLIMTSLLNIIYCELFIKLRKSMLYLIIGLIKRKSWLEPVINKR